jgi:hypothetical protein
MRGCVSPVIRLIAAIAAATMGFAATSASAQASVSCSDGIFDVVARIEFIVPSTARATVRKADGTTRPAARGDCLHSGETLMISSGVKKVVLSTGGDTIDRGPGDPPFQTGNRFVNAFSGSARFLSSLYGAVAGEGWAPPRPTYTREAVEPLHVVGVLADMPVGQRFVPTLANGKVAISWWGGMPGWSCSLGTEKRVIDLPERYLAPACEMPARASDTRLVIADKTGREIGWTLELATPDDVPKPDWIKTSATLTPADRLAWGSWLLDDESVGAEWKLLGYSMIAANRERYWIAGQMLARMRKPEKCLSVSHDAPVPLANDC